MSIGVFVFVGVQNVKASPSQFTSVAKTANATSTVNYILPGLATTTLVYDSREFNGTNQTGGANGFNADSASLLVQFHASSSPNSTLKYRFLFSDDGVDYYSENEVLNINATTTTAVASFHEYSWLQIASTTETSTVGNGTATSSVASRLIAIPAPLRYTKVLFYVPIGSANSAVWAKIIGKKEVAIY